MANKSNQSKMDTAGGLVIGGGLLLGMGVGFFTEELVAGMFTGLGGGLIVAAALVVLGRSGRGDQDGGD